VRPLAGLQRRAVADEEAGAAARFEVAACNQLVVGADHGERRHAVRGGELADRRHAGAGAQHAVVDAGRHAAHDLVAERFSAFAA